MWTGSLYQFVLPPAEKGEAIIIIGIRRRTREIRESPLSSCQGLPHRVYVCDSSAGLLYTSIRTSPELFVFSELDCAVRIPLFDSLVQPSRSDRQPSSTYESHTRSPAYLFHVNSSSQQPGRIAKKLHTHSSYTLNPPIFLCDIIPRISLALVSPSPRHPKKSKQLSFQNSFEICLSWVLASSSPSALTTPDAVSDTRSPFCGRFARENFK